jgi:endogenous inhibitor of DNA gyrase (YacG/DUF329 family)
MTAVRGEQAQYRCHSCGKLFTARVADRNRGWAKFCSKSCKQIMQEEGKKIWKILKK